MNAFLIDFACVQVWDGQELRPMTPEDRAAIMQHHNESVPLSLSNASYLFLSYTFFYAASRSLSLSLSLPPSLSLSASAIMQHYSEKRTLLFLYSEPNPPTPEILNPIFLEFRPCTNSKPSTRCVQKHYKCVALSYVSLGSTPQLNPY